MSQENHGLIERSCGCQLLYAPDLLKLPSADYLKVGILRQADSVEKIVNGGRGQAWFVQVSGMSLVLRAYQRGGLVAKFNRESYLGFSVESSRAFKEWRLLQWMSELGLPVPRPVAASVCRWPVSFSPLYRAHILLERINNVVTLDQLLTRQAAGEQLWKAIGRCIRKFHDVGVYHDDLNASNILLAEDQSVYLIDFDKGERRGSEPSDAQWKQNNLARLQRSLLKQQAKHPQYFYFEKGWQDLLFGYD